MESLVLSCGGRGRKVAEERQRRCSNERQPLCLGHRLQLLPCGGGADEDSNEECLINAHHQQHQQLERHLQQQHLASMSKKIARIELNDRYIVLRHIGSGTFGNVILALCVKDQVKVALKKLPKTTTKFDDFLREFHYSFRLAAHPVIVKTFDVAFETKTSYVFAQEYAPKSDLLKSVPPRVGLSECKSKAVVRQIGSALEYIHEKEVVHRDVKLENILVFDEKLFRVKLADFGVAREAGTVVCKVCSGTTYTPPEICNFPKGKNYRVETSADVWSFGVVIFCLLTGSFPWQMAEYEGDPLFDGFVLWQTGKTDEYPEHWRRFTPVLMRLFRRILEIRPKKRSPIQVLSKFTDHSWIVKTPSAPHHNQSHQHQHHQHQHHHQQQQKDQCNQEQCIECRKEDANHQGTEHSGSGGSRTDCYDRVAKVSDWLLSQVSSSSSSAF